MESEKLRIKLDSPENTYYAGQEIKGLVTVILTKTTDIKSIDFKIQGKGKCRWIDILKLKEKENVVCKSDLPIVRDCGNVVKSRPSLPPGDHSFPFTYQLPGTLPSSIKGSYGEIKYKLKLTVNKAWHLKTRYCVPLTLIDRVSLSRFPEFSENKFRQVTRTVGVFESKPITLTAELPVGYGVRDREMDLFVTVDNASKNHIEKLKFSVIKNIRCFITNQKRDEEIKIYKKDTGGIDKFTSRSFAYKIPIKGEPSSTHIPFIEVTYKICVQIVFNIVDLIRWNPITVVLPFCVITEPPNLNSSSNNCYTYPSPLQNASLYSNSSVDSPLHLSQYHNRTESLSSTITSNSSAATLSAGNPFLPQAYNDYSSSPSDTLTINEISDARNRLSVLDESSAPSLSPNCSMNTNSDGYEHRSSNRNSSFIGWRTDLPSTSHAGANVYPRDELPPSYEELYGDSSANGGVPAKI